MGPPVGAFVLVVMTEQLDATVAFYRDVLGGEPGKQWDGPGARGALVHVGPGVVEVLAADGRAPEPPNPSVQLALETDDVDGWHARLIDAGAPIAYGPIDLGSGGRSVGTLDPNGVRVSFFTPSSP
jgi:catechol 2,3-dioxygenase-like lactoylglutathione lyase family enzyme